MPNLIQAYWDWRDKPKTKFKTSQGNTVKRFESDKWAVCATTGYYDLRSSFTWTSDSPYFKDCLASKSTIESRFGKIIGLEENE